MLRLYRLALSLCPPAFRHDFAADMLLDAADARTDAVSAGSPHALWQWRAQIAVDLTRTVATQWLRTGLPMIGFSMLVGGAVPLAVAAAVGAVARRLRFDVPGTLADADAIAFVLVAALLLCVISMTIVITFWTSRMQRRIRR